MDKSRRIDFSLCKWSEFFPSLFTAQIHHGNLTTGIVVEHFAKPTVASMLLYSRTQLEGNYFLRQNLCIQPAVESIFVVNNLLRNHKHERIRRYSYAMRYSENRYQQQYRKGRVRGNRILLSYKNHDATLRHRVLNSIPRVY